MELTNFLQQSSCGVSIGDKMFILISGLLLLHELIHLTPSGEISSVWSKDLLHGHRRRKISHSLEHLAVEDCWNGHNERVRSGLLDDVRVRKCCLTESQRLEARTGDQTNDSLSRRCPWGLRSPESSQVSPLVARPVGSALAVIFEPGRSALAVAIGISELLQQLNGNHLGDDELFVLSVLLLHELVYVTPSLQVLPMGGE